MIHNPIDRIQRSQGYVRVLGNGSVSIVPKSGQALAITAPLNLSGNLAVTGNLTVSGTIETVNSVITNILDTELHLAVGASSPGSALLVVERGNGNSSRALRWYETGGAWQLNNNGTNYYDLIHSGGSQSIAGTLAVTGVLTNSAVAAASNNNLTLTAGNSVITVGRAATNSWDVASGYTGALSVNSTNSFTWGASATTLLSGSASLAVNSSGSVVITAASSQPLTMNLQAISGQSLSTNQVAMGADTTNSGRTVLLSGRSRFEFLDATGTNGASLYGGALSITGILTGTSTSTSTLAGPLQVNRAATTTSSNMQINVSSGTVSKLLGLQRVSAYRLVEQIESNDDITIHTATGSAGAESYIEALRFINSSGKLWAGVSLGIGITPGSSYKLDVAGAANLNSGLSSGTALTINGQNAIVQGATYLQWGSGVSYNYFNTPVLAGGSATSPTGQVQITPGSSATIGLYIKGASSQSADLTKWITSADVSLLGITSAGALQFHQNTLLLKRTDGTTVVTFGDGTNNNVILAQSVAAGKVPIVAQGSSGQTADLQQWQDSSANIIAKVDNNGNVFPKLGGYIRGTNSSGTGSGAWMEFNTSTTLWVASAASQYFGIKGSGSHTASLQEWQNSSGTALSKIGPDGWIYANSGLSVLSTGTAITPMTVKGYSGQTADLQQWQNNSATVLTNVTSAGQVSAVRVVVQGGTSNLSGKSVYAGTGATTNIGIVVQGVASQSANLQEWQNNSSTVLTKVDAIGEVTAPAYKTTSYRIQEGATGFLEFVYAG